MSDEDFDEFPSIEVNSSLPEARAFVMPSAEAVAEARAREEETERELRRLRAQLPEGGAAGDSSGSEGEGALAAAAAALRLQPARASPPAPPLRPLAALLAALPPPAPPFLLRYAEAARDRPEADVAALTSDLLSDAAEMACEAARRWTDEEFLGVAGWACAVAAAGRGGGLLRRTLQALLEEAGSEAQAEALRAALGRAAGALGAEGALALCGALRSGGGERGARLARDLAVRALAALAALPDDETVSLEACALALARGGWRRLPPARRYLALQLLARAGGGAEARGALAALLAAPPAPPRAHSADMLKVLVAASKLSVLFHVQE